MSPSWFGVRGDRRARVRPGTVDVLRVDQTGRGTLPVDGDRDDVAVTHHLHVGLGAAESPDASSLWGTSSPFTRTVSIVPGMFMSSSDHDRYRW